MLVYMMVAFQRQEIYGRSFQAREIMHKKLIDSQHCLLKISKKRDSVEYIELGLIALS